MSAPMTTCGGWYHDENREVQDCTPATPCRSCLMAEVERLRVPAYHVLVDARELESLRGAVKDALEILYEEGAIGVDNDCVESLCKATGRDYGEVMTGPPE